MESCARVTSRYWVPSKDNVTAAGMTLDSIKKRHMEILWFGFVNKPAIGDVFRNGSWKMTRCVVSAVAMALIPPLQKRIICAVWYFITIEKQLDIPFFQFAFNVWRLHHHQKRDWVSASEAHQLLITREASHLHLTSVVFTFKYKHCRVPWNNLVLTLRLRNILKTPPAVDLLMDISISRLKLTGDYLQTICVSLIWGS